MDTPLIPISASDLVSRFVAIKNAGSPKRALSADTVSSYRAIFDAFERFVSVQPGVSPCRTAWVEASPLHAHLFLTQHVQPRTSARGSPVPSPVTRKRYWSVLHALYHYAQVNQHCPSNPFPQELAKGSTEQSESMVLPPSLWRALLHQIDHTSPTGKATPAQTMRDQLLLLLIMRAALTSTELRQLTLAHVQHPRLRTTPTGITLDAPAPASSESPSPICLALTGTRAMQNRTLALHPQAEKAVFTYLAFRLGPDCPHPKTPSALLLPSRKGRAFTPMTTRAVFNIVQSYIARVCTQLDLPFNFQHAGPNTLRSHCLVHWINQGCSIPEVLKRAGLKNEQALLRLRRHFNIQADTRPLFK